MSKKGVILIAAGGTGGHVFPGLALAEALKAKGYSIVWIGTAKGIEATLVPKAEIPLALMQVTGLRGKGIRTLLFAPFQLLRACYAAYRVIRQYKPQLVIGLGGFVCGPAGLAAFLSRTPLVLHEQNSVPGMTNRLLMPLAVKVFSSFPEAFKESSKVIVTGNPVRFDIAALQTPTLRFQDRIGPLRILVLGGSMGAVRLNEIVPQALSALSMPVTIWHQCGKAHYDQALQIYQQTSLDYRLTPFIDNMAKAYDWADIVICRAGATTVFELMAAGLGSILIPYPHAVDDHQTENGRYLATHGAAVVMSQHTLTPSALAEKIHALGQRSQCMQMAMAARQLYQKDATIQIVENCEEVISESI